MNCVPREFLNSRRNGGDKDVDLGWDQADRADRAEKVEAKEAGLCGVVVEKDGVEGATVAD